MIFTKLYVQSLTSVYGLQRIGSCRSPGKHNVLFGCHWSPVMSLALPYLADSWLNTQSDLNINNDLAPLID